MALRPIITAPNEQIELIYRFRHAQTVVLSSDGQELPLPDRGDYVTAVTVEMAKEHLRLLRYQSDHYYYRVGKTFLGGE
jgi:NAD kinase